MMRKTNSYLGPQVDKNKMKEKKKKWEEKVEAMQAKLDKMQDDLMSAKINNAQLEGQVTILKWQIGQGKGPN